jgi:hypothetical protein
MMPRDRGRVIHATPAKSCSDGALGWLKIVPMTEDGDRQ